MFDDPWPTPVARPPAIVATPTFEEVHVAEDVKSCVLPSLIVPDTVNGWVRPLAIEAEAGATAKLTKTGAVTVRLAAGEVILPDLAVTFEDPCPTPLATPAALIVATDKLADVQRAELVRSLVVWSE
jgi:hypothetical protein